MIKRMCVYAAVLALAPLSLSYVASADTNPTQPSDANNFEKSPAVKAPPSQVTNKKPTEVVEQAKVSTIHNPYTGKADMIAEGKKVFFGAGCNGCHGGGGGGGMCPPLTNDVWVYGGDDDTLFRLIALGSEGLGRQRTGRENVKGPMPPHGDIVKSQDDMWKIISWIRTVYKYDAKGTPWEQK